MNFNPLRKLKINTGDRIKDMYLKKMKSQTWEITKSIFKGQLTSKQVNVLEKLYNEYYKKNNYFYIYTNRNNINNYKMIF